MTVLLPWGAQKETMKPQQTGDMDLRPGEFVMQSLFADFTAQAEKKMEAVMTETVSLVVFIIICFKINLVY